MWNLSDKVKNVVRITKWEMNLSIKHKYCITSITHKYAGAARVGFAKID